MSSKKNPNSHARLIPQKCSLCSNPGHNRNSRDCPVNLFNVEKQQLINVHSAELARLLDIEQQLQLHESSSSSGDPSSQNDHSTMSHAPFSYLPPPQDKQSVDRMVAEYERGLADREAAQYKVSRPSSCSMDIVTATEHRAITLSKPYYDQVSPTARMETSQ